MKTNHIKKCGGFFEIYGLENFGDHPQICRLQNKNDLQSIYKDIPNHQI